MVIYYNCGDPLAIINDGLIRTSKISGGVSLSSWPELGSHGPFKIIFRWHPDFAHLIEVKYWNVEFRGLKPAKIAVSSKNEMLSELEYLDVREKYLVKVPDRFKYKVWRESMMFSTEHEWFSPEPIRFDRTSVIAVTFMKNAPKVIGPNVLRQRIFDLQNSGIPFNERSVKDPYFRRANEL